jgi:hypothetical protein
MLTAAFTLLGELAPAASNPAADALAARLEESLRHCVEIDDRGQVRLTLTLPGSGNANDGAKAALTAFAGSLARLLPPTTSAG